MCPLTSSANVCGLTVTFVYILFHISISSMIYIIFPNLSCLGVGSQVGKGYYQQMTLLKVDVFSLGQILAVSYSYRQLQGQFLPSHFLRTVALDISIDASGTEHEHFWEGLA